MNATNRKIVKDVTQKQHVEFGLVAILVTSFLSLYLRERIFVSATFLLTLITLTVPIVFYPFTVLWFGFSRLLGAVSSRILLSIIFFLIVTPVAVFRRMTGKDTLRLKAFKKDKQSVFTDRNHVYKAADMTDTF